MTSIPEWELEDAIIRDLSLIHFPGVIENPRFVTRQQFLPRSGRFIDLLLKDDRGFVIVEIKNEWVNDVRTVDRQVLAYRGEFSDWLGILAQDVKCVLVSSEGFSEEVRSACEKYGVFTRIVCEEEVLRDRVYRYEDLVARTIHEHRLQALHLVAGWPITHDLEARIQASSDEWVSTGEHDHESKRQLAALFCRVSEHAPMMAHEIGTQSAGRLHSNEQKWYWLFYSVLDRRSNASVFRRAREVLEQAGLFWPRDICGAVMVKGAMGALDEMRDRLRRAGFPLLRDQICGFDSQPRSVIDAARFMERYGFDFDALHDSIACRASADPGAAFDIAWREFQKSIYGVGHRIAGQIIRGLTLKGDWDMSLHDQRALEWSDYNAYIAGPARLRLTRDHTEREYRRALGAFADDFLHGNRGIVSHVLWYTRKCWYRREPIWFQYPFAGYCSLFLRRQLDATRDSNLTPRAIQLSLLDRSGLPVNQ